MRSPLVKTVDRVTVAYAVVIASHALLELVAVLKLVGWVNP